MIRFVRYLIFLSIHVVVVILLALFILAYVLPFVFHIHLATRAEGI